MKKISIITISSIFVLSSYATSWSGLNGTSFVTVGDINNKADTTTMNDSSTSYGSVSYKYSIGQHEVTNSQYVNFLNSVGSTTSSLGNSLYAGIGNGVYGITADLNGNTHAGIELVGNKFSTIEGKGNFAVNNVSAYAAAMYTNWLSNGGTSTSSYLTGVYDFDTYGCSIDVFNNNNTNRTGETYKYMIASENEWYKAAYYNADTDSYSKYANGKNTITNTDANYDTSDIKNVNYGAESYYGTYGQAGNVWEWSDTVDVLTPNPNISLSLRGGSFYNFQNRIGSNYRERFTPGAEYFNYGFRLVSLIEVSTIDDVSSITAENQKTVEANEVIVLTDNEKSVEILTTNDSITISKVEVLDEVNLINGNDVLSAWDFTIEDVTSENSVVLTFLVGEGYDLSEFSIYHSEDNENWDIADITGLAYDGEYLSFVVDGFSAYAVTQVPEPSTYAMIFGALALGFAYYRKRK